MILVLIGLIVAANPYPPSGHWSEPLKLADSINSFFPSDSAGSVYHAHLAPDGTELYYTIADFEYADDIYVVRYNDEKDSWDSITRLSVNANDIRRELSPSITADHSRLFWCSWNRPGGYGSYDVWYAEWDTTICEWGEPKNAGPNVNTPGSEFTCFIAPDGKTLYVSSDYDSDCDDIYKHTLLQDYTWSSREGVFEELHTGTCEYDPWVSADGMWLYFSMWTGGRTIWRSRWQGQFFADPEMLSEPVFVNGDWQFNDAPSLNAEADKMYFSSNRPDSNRQWQYMWCTQYLKDSMERGGDSNMFDLIVHASTRKKVEFTYSLPESLYVFCGILDSAGNLIRILTAENQYSGDHTLVWDGKDDRGCFAANGTYFIRLTIDRRWVIKKKVFLR